MATNQLSKFGDQSGTTYSEGTGLRYTDSYWGGTGGPSVRNTGFIPNTPISPIQMNTLFSQTTMCSYILGQVLASDAIKTKAGTSTITEDITSELTQDDVNTNYASKFIDFLNRINQISGNGGTGTESVWRSRQIGYGDSGDFWKVVNTSSPSTQCALSPSSTSCGLWVNSISRFTGSTGSTPTLTFNASNIASSHQITAPSANITGLTSTNSLSVSTTTALEGALTANGTVTLGNAASDTVTINGNTNVESTITIKGGKTINIGETSGGANTSSNRATLYLWTQYNTAGKTTSDGTFRRYTLNQVLQNIGTRLDNLGFSSASVTFIGSSVSGAIRRQGNYVFCNIQTTRYLDYDDLKNYCNANKTIMTIPSGYEPKSTQNSIVVLMTESERDDVGRTMKCTLSAGSRNVIVSFLNVTTGFGGMRDFKLYCCFGYEANAR